MECGHSSAGIDFIGVMPDLPLVHKIACFVDK